MLLSIESVSELLSNRLLVAVSDELVVDVVLDLGSSYYSLLDYVRYDFVDEIDYS
jgi:hypothetical protein